jgi:Tol biopolymer transport system component
MQLTNFSDSATSPALSRDGRMLTFIRGASTFDGPGQIYVKLLPGGDPVQLTHDDVSKMSPVFSPDGTRIAYTSAGHNWNWDTWVVPTLGGAPSRTLRNASGLTWIDGGDPQPLVLFSTLTGKGLQMAVVTSAESLAQRRDVYVPPETGMAHRSYLSPDHKWILLVEMDINRWLPCRLVPYDGSTKGKPVGPAPSQCTGAAWSSDGRWMYFSANAGSAFHIWRQHFPDGSPQQVTFGATEEEGVALAPDGHSFVTSVGTSQSTVWINDAGGERQLTSEGYGLLPALSVDGRKLYYLERTTGDQHYVSGALWSVDLQSGQREHLLRDYVMQHFSISPDGNQVVFVPIDDAGRSSVWTATLDGRSAPRQLTSKEATRTFFGSSGDVIFMAEEDRANFVYRIKGDGTHLQKVVPVPVLFVYSVSADGRWVAAWVAGTTDDKLNSVAVYPVEGGAPMTICGDCASAGGPERGRRPPKVSWSPDMKFVYLSIGGSKTYAFSLRPGQILPPLPAGGLNSSADLAALPGARLVSERQVFGGPNPSIYTYLQATTHRNIYRIPVP